MSRHAPWNDSRIAANGVPVWKNFATWFGHSKIVDAEGHPQVLYHGTDADFAAFDPTHSRAGAAFGPGIYLTEAARNTDWKRGPGAQVMPLFVRGCNPLDIRSELCEDEARALRGIGIAHAKACYPAPLISMERRFGSVSAAAQAASFDALLHYGPGGQRHVLVFGPESLKSAIGNSGLYRPGPSLCDSVSDLVVDQEADVEPDRPRQRA